MNRIKIGPPGTMTQPVQPNIESEFPGTFHVRESELQHQIQETYREDRSAFMPLHYEANYAYPLIVWLHDQGGNEDGLAETMMSISERNYVGVAPRGPVSSWDGGYEWPQTRDCVHQSHSSVVAAIDEACCRFNIATDRIFLAGVGSGGTMAFRLACREPELFAGVISINGQFPEQFKPLARLKSCRSLPVLWGHARQSNQFSETQLCQQLRLLHVCGFSVTLRQYPCGDEIMPQAFRDINVWIMDSINGTDQLSE